MKVIRAGLLIATTLILTACAKAGLTIDDQRNVINAERPVLLTHNARARLFKQMKANRDIWERTRPKSYQYRWGENCVCPSAAYYGPSDIHVENSEVTKIIYQGEMKEADNIENRYNTGDVVTSFVADSHKIDYLFTILEDILQRTPSNYNSSWGAGVNQTPLYDAYLVEVEEMLTVQYDDVYKYPKLISFDALEVSDDQYTISITNFDVQ